MAKKKATPSRTRRRQLPVKHKELAQYLVDSLDSDLTDRSEWNDMRVQRYAKLRGWTEPKDYPWADASNVSLTYIQTECQLTQDTLHNAVLARHPIVESRAINEADMDKQKGIDELLDYQFFVENSGENKLAEVLEHFVQDGVFLVYTPWVRYDESIVDTRIFDPVLDDLSIAEAVVNGIMASLPNVTNLDQKDADGYRWTVDYIENGKDKTCDVDAYIEEEGGRLELCLKREVRVFDGPCPIAKSVDEWVAPWRAANFQPPSPSNPNGAERVILLDYPNVDEIRRLHAQGYYDLMTAKELEDMEGLARADPEREEENSALKELKDDLEGIHGGNKVDGPEEVKGADKLTRMLCFLGWDVNGDGLNEQIVVEMIKETKQLLRVRYLTEDYPSDPPRRPLAGEAYISISGRIYGISLIELIESIHDRMKMNYDQMVDSATVHNLPWFAYRPSSSLNPESFKLEPGLGIPMNDPKNDLFFPQFPTQSEGFGMNMMALLAQEGEKASMQGDIQFGRVPKGKASALRTASGMQSLLAKGDARPERVLRRFFSGFVGVYAMMHELNQRFLPEKKQFRLMQPDATGKSVYATVDNVQQIQSRMDFTFKAGMFNSNKESAIEVLQTLMGMLINPMTLQLGIVGAEQVYNLLTDFIKLVQHEPTRYIAQPQQGPPKLQLTADEVMSILQMGRMPTEAVVPKEPPQAHIQRIMEIVSLPEMQDLPPLVQSLVNVYLTRVQTQMQQAQQQQQLLQNAQQFQQSMGQGGPTGPTPTGAPPNPGTSGNPMINSGELLDESMPTAR